jgi:hypothetical protein
LKMTVTERSALVQVSSSTQRITAHAGLVLVRELAERLGVPESLDQITVKKRDCGYSPAQSVLALCKTLIVGGECLDDAALQRGGAAQELSVEPFGPQSCLRSHSVPDPTTLARLLARFRLGRIGQLNRVLDELFARVHPLVERERVTVDLRLDTGRAPRAGRNAEGHPPHLRVQGLPGTRCSASSARRASGCMQGSVTARPPPPRAHGASWQSGCVACRSTPALTRASGVRTSSPSSSARKSLKRRMLGPAVASSITRRPRRSSCAIGRRVVRSGSRRVWKSPPGSS